MHIVDQFAIDPHTNLIENFSCSPDTDIGSDQRILKFVQKIGIDLPTTGNHVFDAVDESGASFLDSCLQAVEQRRLLRNRTE